ncbi:hypothetical protein AV521_31290 [Streptomyces sp. IMTB 2501]|nr:hypothetical protein AV521_31290 [Streptomyces sp. IMTB 2501]
MHSFKLAAEAGEHEFAATALRGLADQAVDLGHPPLALRLAEGCERYGTKLGRPKPLAYYRNTFARAAAADGDGATAVRMLPGAQAAIQHAPTSRAVPGRPAAVTADRHTRPP